MKFEIGDMVQFTKTIANKDWVGLKVEIKDVSGNDCYVIPLEYPNDMPQNQKAWWKGGWINTCDLEPVMSHNRNGANGDNK